ncbi:MULTISPECIES: TetR/AcrR family transcriptional regulator [Myxococcaceae]|uniref:TetR/AcrR family transcriptional regulator n=1 Tax=Myxococcaceae TaxID=31 RepID=UPI00188E8DA8|nr:MULTISPECIES: TetR/AcrR family transcriptional regulator [Myxococcaceae]MBF5041519.1 TetR/AcrR family transcriptional regulator [Simulacricoccus sp. 17bor-14]
MKAERAYRMVARAEAAERTRLAVLDAALALFSREPFADITLQEIADEAGVALQTVLRKFGSKEGLFAAAGREAERRVRAERTQALPSSVDAALLQLAASYERVCDFNWRALCQEDQFTAVAAGMEAARALHREWISRVFAAELGGVAPAERARRLALLFGATDFYLWKLYRKDLGHSRAVATSLIRDAVRALQQQFGTGARPAPGGRDEQVPVRDDRGRGQRSPAAGGGAAARRARPRGAGAG